MEKKGAAVAMAVIGVDITRGSAREKKRMVAAQTQALNFIHLGLYKPIDKYSEKHTLIVII